jgi:hypothetical protein
MSAEKRRIDERGAISIKTVVLLFLTATVAFLLIKFAPVYIEQRKIMYDVEELARISAVRGYGEPKIAPEIKKISSEYDLPEGSISFIKREGANVHIGVNYTRSVDLLVTSYDWKVEQTVIGKEL